MPRSDKVSTVAIQVAEGREDVVDVHTTMCFPTGSTLLNLAVSDRADGGWGAGKVVNLVGDSNTGKTLLVLTGLMEMTFDKMFDDHKLVYDDAENALEMPVEAMFGPELANGYKTHSEIHMGQKIFTPVKQ